MRQLVYSRIIATSSSHPTSSPVIIQEYLRYQNDIKVYDIEILIDPVLSNKPPRCLTSRLILSDLLKFNDTLVQKFENMCVFIRDDVKYMFALLNFWLKFTSYDHTDMKGIKNENFKRAMLVAFMKLSVIDPLKIERPTRQPEQQSLSSLKKCERQIGFVENYLCRNSKEKAFQLASELTASSQENFDYLKEIKVKLNSFCPSFSFYENELKNRKANNKLDKFNLKIIHFLNEFQTIYLSYNFVCDIYNDSNDEENNGSTTSDRFRPLKLDRFFNGSFLHNFIEELESRVNPELYIFDLFGQKSAFKQIYSDLIDFYNKVF